MLITKEMLKKFVRFEITGEMFDDGFEIEEKYQAALDDFIALANNLEAKKDESFITLDDEWLHRIIDQDGVASALGLENYVDGEWDSKVGLIKNDENLIAYILNQVVEASASVWDMDDPTIGHMVYLSDIHKAITDYDSNKSKPLTEWEFPDGVKASFVDYVAEQEHHPEMISADELILFKRYVEELIAKDNITALHAKGYLCYGGSPFYECDWYTSRDCITRAFELTTDPGYANTLGYIYYYGRCNNGIPEYDKAFQYFTFGHANKWYESSYKLADMYRNGRGTVKSEVTANQIIEDLYEYAYKDLCRGKDSKFADIALRMGGIMESQDAIYPAYTYYLQAYYAIKRRESADYYGDGVVRKGIEEGLERTRAILEHEVRKGKKSHGNIGLLSAALADDYYCEGIVRPLKNGYKLTIMRIPKRSEREPALMFLTLPDYDFCSLTDHINLYFDGEWNKETLPESFLFNDYYYDWDSEDPNTPIELRLFGVTVAKVSIDNAFEMKLTRYDKGNTDEDE